MADDDMILMMILDEIADDGIVEQIRKNAVTASTLSTDYMVAAYYVMSFRDPVRVEGYVDEVVNFYSDIEFKSHFRMRRSTFEALCQAVAPIMKKERSMTLQDKMLSTLWLLGNKECYRSVADRFGISKGTLHLVVMNTSNAICSLKEVYIKFPQTRNEMRANADGFRERCGLPGVVGAIDGTYVPVPAPQKEYRASFINRKGVSSMQLQVVCDSRLQFIDTYTGWPGSVHDARVYRNSPVSDLINSLPNEFHVLGDSAYPLSPNLLVPYRDNGVLEKHEKKFNKTHSSTRVDIERAIGLLKCKFRRLKSLDMNLQDMIPEVITACCVLHNVILQCEEHEEFVDSDIIEDEEDEEEEEEGCTSQRSGSGSTRGKEKRRDIAMML